MDATHVADPLPTLATLESLYGRRLVASLGRHLAVLRRRERKDAHGNRELFLSDLFVAQLLAFHLPIVRSLRTLEALSHAPVAQKMLTVERLPRSTMSDANKVVDSSLLTPLLAYLVRRLDGRTLPEGLDALTRRLIAVDGTFLRVVGELLWALRQRVKLRGRGGAIVRKVVSKPRLDVQFDVAAGVPRFAVLSGRERSEGNAARLRIEPGKIYLADKAYFSFALLSDWLEGDADFVVALNSQIRFTPDEAAPAADAGPILSDRLGRLPGCDHSTPPTRRLREVIVRRDSGEPLRLLTSLIDPSVTAEMIGELYRRRWTIELFFRWLKGCANFRHVISHSPNGLSVALYVALIGTLLTALVTQRRPGKYVLTSLSFVAAGMATWEDMQPAMEQFERERAQARARDAAKRARTAIRL